MAESTTQEDIVPESPVDMQIDWNALAKTLKTGSAAEAQKRAYEIAEFVARVESDSNSELILKTGIKQLALTLNK
jgi:hypothetical protein